MLSLKRIFVLFVPIKPRKTSLGAEDSLRRNPQNALNSVKAAIIKMHL